MKAQDWYPEIVLTSAPYQDLDLYARNYDQKVWSHALGLAWFRPYLTGRGDHDVGLPVVLGYRPGHPLVDRSSRARPLLSDQFVGPELTAKATAARNEIFEATGYSGGAYDDSIFTIEVNPAAPPAITQRPPPGWWDPDAEGPGNYNLGGTGKGKYVYLHGAKRYLPGDFPKGKQPYFDEAASTVLYDARLRRSRWCRPTPVTVPEQWCRGDTGGVGDLTGGCSSSPGAHRALRRGRDRRARRWRISSTARAAEADGFATGWVPHIPWSLDGLTAVALAGQVTDRIELGTAGDAHLHPAIPWQWRSRRCRPRPPPAAGSPSGSARRTPS